MTNKIKDKLYQNKILISVNKLYNLQYNVKNYFDNSEANKKIKKEDNGEVLTPFGLVFEMLSEIPEYIWRDKSLKWLDPVVGDGHFMIILYFVLMDYLPNEEFMYDKKMKSHHILTNMLYMNDINSDNCKRTIQLFKLIEPNVNINIRCKDFLQVKLIDYSDIKFDIIVMNPPYNLQGIKSKGQKNVWVYFSVKAFELLRLDGFLLAIHPSCWRINNYKPWGTKVNIHEIYFSKNILHVSMYTIIQTYEMMNVQINLDYLLIHNNNKAISKHKNFTKQLMDITNIYGENYKIDIRSNSIIANFGHSVINKLILLSEKYGSLHDLLYHTSELHHDLWKKKKINEGPYEIIHLMKKKGKTIYMSERAHTHQKTPKIIINGFGVKYVYFDEEGKYGVTDTPFIILSSNQQIYNMLTYGIWNYIVNSLGILGNNLNERVFLYIPNIENIIKKRGLNIREIMEEKELYDLLEFTEIESKKIQEFNNNNVQNLKLKNRK